jgi:anaerobic selenocysteine-containing dehydrogenase
LDALLMGSVLGMDFAALAAAGTVPIPSEPVPQFADLTFPTPSGKVELASAQAEADGHPRVPQPWADPRPVGGRLRLLSPASPWTLNDSFANAVRVGRQLGPASILLHPEDAAERGLANGELAQVTSEVGTLTLQVAVSDEVPQGVAVAHKGRWPKREAAGANVNVLNPGRKADMGESTAVHGIEVVVRATPGGAGDG